MFSINRWYIVFVTILIVGSLWIWWSRVPEPVLADQRTPQPAPNYPAPDFSLRTLDGDTISLSDLAGRPVLINFWATWCGPCRAEMPMLQAASQLYADDVVFLGIDQGETAPVVQSFVDEFGLSFPILLDEPMTTADLYNVRGLPTTVFVDGDGVIRQIYPGELNSAILAEGLQEILR